ncbi:MFS transporter [Mesorhizobium sp. AR07]|uniref:MFS transporter n=1 Tax=Mesorhizobium sp. AR07 TaxID=2865838 RepID=UPI00215E0ED3|nr:MFS transporter [Mesorhizobium sp. AR07]UVK43796.1 MFS transporter [Mesorhizobium sp. AR07]
MIFSFGPTMLVERGWSSSSAGSTISIVLWLAAFSVPFGGFLADRTKRGDAILVAGCVAFALLMLFLSRSGPVLPFVIALGLVCGLPAGAIMSLPPRVLERKTRPIGMGLFYTVYYAGMLVGPAIGGRISTSAGAASAALDFGAIVLLLCPVILWLFRRIVASQFRSAVSST